MTIELRQAGPEGGGRARAAAGTPGRLSIGAARAILLWERFWPVALPVLAPAFVVLVLALFGVFALTPSWLRWAVVALAGAASVAALLRYGRELAPPTRREALERLEQDGAVAHAPLQALEDRPFAGGDGPLWRAHLEDMARRARAARLKAPRATVDERDPWSLRFGALGVLVVALAVAGPERDARIAGLFAPGPGAAGAARVDLWIEPPAYTGRAPVFLMRAGEKVSGARAQVDAPQGSRVIAAAPDLRGAALSLITPDDRTVGAAESGRLALTLERSGLIRMRIGGSEGRWPVGVIPDAPPQARFIVPPAATDDARLAVAVEIEDDYGVAGAALHLKLDPAQKRPLDAPAFDEASVRAERVIELDGLAGKPGERRFDLDLQADPWAGLAVVGRIVVRDGAGQRGATEEEAFELPARPFYNPLARAVVEQRQTLAVSPGDWRRAGRSFDALTLAPERFFDRPGEYLLVRTAFWRVMREGRAADFSGSVREFWPLALQLEDEALELARRRLEAAREALRQALERGAGDDEISRLVEELRQAMRQYLQALAESGQRMADGDSPRGEVLGEGDLEQMLDAIRDLSESGARNAARQALSDLENLLDNLRLSMRGQGQGDGRGQGQQGQGGAAGAAGDLIGRQRDLSNRSFDRGREPGANADDLAREERALRNDLQALRDGVGDNDPDGSAARAFNEAMTEMGRAADALDSGDFGAATTAMERAIAGMRDGAEALAREEARQARQERGDGRGQALDPLGRPAGDPAGGGVDVPDGIETRSARDVLDELRRRLSDGKRSEEEIRYLERLLERF